MKLNTTHKFFPVILITAVVAGSVALLTATDIFTRETIEAQKEEEIRGMLSEMFPDMSRFTFEDDIYTVHSDGDKIGYAFLAIGKGYGGNIDILVGLEPDVNTVKGITIISQTETPGLGTRITESFFAEQFSGLTIDEVAFKEHGGEVDAITGSTISSTAVVKAIRDTALEKIQLLEAGEEAE